MVGADSRSRRGTGSRTLDVVSSDHCGFSFATAKRAHGRGSGDGLPAFDAIPNGVPGIETRMGVLYSEGVARGRIDLPAFVRLTSFNAARLFGLPAIGAMSIPALD